MTQELFIEVKRRIEGLRDELETGVLNDEPLSNAAKGGAIMAFRDLLDIVSFLEELHGN